MDFRFGGENDAFAAEVRAFLEREMARAATEPDPEDLSGLAEPFERARAPCRRRSRLSPRRDGPG